ncbi:MAG TPA: phosphatidylserine/phosphatidylglycerophosphate/cardiolipin synthase family protein [Bdellovibrio sp.]|uniref:phospholipase D-like domain-containing protein n=1 Tax=Bdellovibrio sp. TaxID=28201 RepID=UPI002EF54989
MSLFRQMRDKLVPALIALALFLNPLLSWAAGPQCSQIFNDSIRDTANGYAYLGDDIQEHLLSIIDQAKSTVDIEMSIEPHQRLMDLLKRKTSEGVRVRAVIDGRHIKKNSSYRKMWLDTLEELKKMGVDYVISDTDALAKSRRYPGAVLHRKIIIVDSQFFYVGSANFSKHPNNFEVGYFGPLVKTSRLQEVFNSDYAAAKDSWIEQPYKLSENPNIQFNDDSVLMIGPGTKYPDFQDVLVKEIQAAQKKILLSIYEATDTKVLKALIAKKEAHPEMDIRVVLCASKMPVWFMHKKLEADKNSYFKANLLKAGIDVRIFGGGNQFNHSRFGLFDETIYGSSADFIKRSFEGSIDLGFLTKDQDLAMWSEHSFDHLWEQSRNVENITLRERLVEGFFMLMEKMTYIFMQIKTLPLPK